MRRIVQFTCGVLLIMGVGISPGVAQEKLTDHTVRLAAGKKSPPAAISDIAWLAGHWIGEGFGGLMEEVWSPPRDGVMIGMFRLVRDGKPVFYEIITLSEEEGSLIMRLKHFYPDLKGWEEKDRTIDFPLAAKAEGSLSFDGLTFRREDEKSVTVFLAMKQKDGRVREERFQYTRVFQEDHKE